jgi:hypothetical protein
MAAVLAAATVPQMADLAVPAMVASTVDEMAGSMGFSMASHSADCLVT